MKANIAILISGNGSNMIAIHRAIMAKEIPAKISFIGCDNPSAPGLNYARQHALEILPLPYNQIPNHKPPKRKFAEQILLNRLNTPEAKITLVCLAGFMQILSADFLQLCPLPIINIHPSLLPDFKGLNTHQRALEAGVSAHGCTVHKVEATLDSGEILGQRSIAITSDLTDAKTLQKAVLIQEHILYPEIITQIIIQHQK